MRIAIILLIVVSLILSIVMSPLVYSLGITAGTCLLLGYWMWRDSKIPKREDVPHKPEPTKVEATLPPRIDSIANNIKTEFENILHSYHPKVYNLISDFASWETYRHVVLGPDTGWVLLQRMSNGVILLRGVVCYNSYLLHAFQYSCDESCNYGRINRLNDMLAQLLRERITSKLPFSGVDYQPISFPDILRLRGCGMRTGEFALNLAYAPTCSVDTSVARQEFYDEQEEHYIEYRRQLERMVMDSVMSHRNELVNYIKERESPNPVFVIDATQTISTVMSGAFWGIFRWSFSVTVGKDMIDITEPCIEGRDINALFAVDEAKTLILNAAVPLLQKTLQSMYSNLEFGPLQDDVKSQKASISITYIE